MAIKKKSKKKSQSVPRLRARKESVWPGKRNVMFRPERSSYVRRTAQAESCVFCDALVHGICFESLVLFQNDHAMLMLNKFPYNSGHLLVLPKRHNGDFTLMTDQELRDVNRLMKLGIEALKKVYQPGGFNIGLNLGAVSGAGIPEHLHWHIIPRWYGDANFYPLIAETKVVIETLEQTYTKLFPMVSKIREGV